MLLPNNPELDTQALAKKLQEVSAHRRRTQPIFSGAPAHSSRENAQILVPQGAGSGLRVFIKRLPVLGPLVAAVYRRTRYMAMPGLTWRQRLRLVPFVGSALAWVRSIIRLNAIRHQLTQEVIALRQLHAGVTARLDQVDARLNAIERERLPRMETLELANRRRLDLAEARLGPAEAGLSDSRERLDRLEALNLAQRMEFQENRIAGLTQELRRAALSTTTSVSPAKVSAKTGELPAPESKAFDDDAFYIEFEGLFRGTREDIQNRQRVYLPYLSRIAANGNAQVVDIGCGRGEWLELLKQEGIPAVGIDMNAAMVDACRERGLAAECMDAIAYLRQQPEDSLAAVTGFHIIEHLPFGTLIALFDAALRALRSDGLIIFETPNPENLIVGSCNFYYDPTHRHPIVPAVAEFIAQQRGFAHAEILRLHPYPDHLRLSEDSEAARLINNVLYGPQDFAVLAWKTHAN